MLTVALSPPASDFEVSRRMGSVHEKRYAPGGARSARCGAPFQNAPFARACP